MKKRNICVVTGSRAEYGLLRPLMVVVRKDRSVRLQLIVTGSHLVPALGSSWREIRKDGFRIDKKVSIITKNDGSSFGTADAMGRALLGFSKAFKTLKPDLIVVLGDRCEILAVVSCALVLRIPVAHIAGGDVTEGAFDDAIRHAITKMSHFHFATNAASAARIRQLGEDPSRVFNVGHLGLDGIRQTEWLNRAGLERLLKFKLLAKNLLITFHPVTLGTTPSERQLAELLKALDASGRNTGLIFTAPNADPGSAKLLRMIKQYVSARPNARFIPSLGHRLYLNTMKHVDAVVGNSSSGVYEAPFMKKPTVDIGNRQKGRLRASSVISCRPEASAIKRAIEAAFQKKCAKTVSPYGDGRTAGRIWKILRSVEDPIAALRKKFRDVVS